jgi:aryl-alcohol dehydrogenase-like predicted oxidoreductase
MMTSQIFSSGHSRRDLIKNGAFLCGSAAFSHSPFVWAESLPLIQKTIPGTSEKIPAIGIGTNSFNTESVANEKDVIKHFADLGGAVIDSAPIYGSSEQVLGDIISNLKIRKQVFLATKLMAQGNDLQSAKASIEHSFQMLRTDVIDLLQVHSLAGTDTAMPYLQELKAAKKIRYLGVTTSRVEQHDELVATMKKHRLDFVQVNYSIDDRDAANKVLPLAQERGCAVLLNVPFGGRRGGNVLKRVANLPLPSWAAEIDAASWGQVFLKYGISHPAVTCAIPGTTQLNHLEDNMHAARGKLPDAAMRKRIEQYWDSLS